MGALHCVSHVPLAFLDFLGQVSDKFHFLESHGEFLSLHVYQRADSEFVPSGNSKQLLVIRFIAERIGFVGGFVSICLNGRLVDRHSVQ